MKRIFYLTLSFLAGLLPQAQGETVILYPDAVSGLSIAGDAGSPTASAVTPVGDTIYMRARDFASGPVRANLNYLRFDLSGLSNPNLQQVTLVLNRVSGDTVVTGRVALFGLLDLPGNAPQDWDASGFGAGAEFDISMFEDYVASSGESPVDLGQVADFSDQDAVSGNTVTLSSEAFVAFLQERADADGLATLLLTIPSQGAGNDKALSYASHTHPDEALRPHLEIVYFDASLPSPPENLRVSQISFTASPDVTLAWDGVAGALNYRVFRRGPGEDEAVEVANLAATSYTDPSVELLETYHYSVSVETADGESIASPEITVPISDPQAGLPEVPSGFELIAAEAGSIAFSWDTSGDALLYEVYRSRQPDRDYVYLGSTTTNTFADSDGLEAYQNYYYIASAIGAGGMSAFSSPFEVAPRFSGEGDAPAAPANVSVAERNNYSMALQWDASEGADAYHVYRSTLATGEPQLLGVTTEPSFFDDYGLYPEHRYHYSIHAINESGFSEASAALEAPAVLTTHRRMEAISRAPVAVAEDEGVYLGWRMLGTDPADVAFNLYRDGALLNEAPITDSTNFLDPEGSAGSVYTIRAIVDGVELAAGEAVTVLPEGYLAIPLDIPAGGTTPDGVSYDYSANDASAADLDGNGEHEIVLKWEPSNAKDNSQAGYTGNVYIDAYKLDGTRLWRIDLGRNIRAGAHYTQFMVYDLDGDGRAELVCKTADATIDGVGTVIGDPAADWRNSGGYILDGPEFLTAFDGPTGAIIDTVDYIAPRGDLEVWGDIYGNRVDRFLAGVGYFDGLNPSVIMARGYYRGMGGGDGRTVIAAFDLIDGELVERWVFDSLVAGAEWAGQGNHQLAVGDVDADGRDEVLYGSMVVDDDGTGLYTTDLGHGDAMHFGDFDPTRPGLEVVAVKESANAPVHVEYRDAATGELIWGWFNARDTGRGLVADVDPTYPGGEVWGSANLNVWSSQGDVIGIVRPSINFATWWDADLLRELTDGNSVRKWDYVNQREVPIMVADGASANNGTKANSALQADLLGDWREEVVFRSDDSSELRVYTTTDLTAHRIPTLMHDPVYRLAVAWQNVSYNQPPHPSFFIGNNMPAAPLPNIFVDPVPALVGELDGGVYASAVTVVLPVNRSLDLYNEYRVDGGSWTPYTEPFTLAEDGDYTVTFRTLDTDGAVLATASTDLSIRMPVPGDLNGDGVVDKADRKLIQQARGSCAGDPDYVADADYTEDGCVTQDDYKIWNQLFVDYKQGTRG